MRRGGRGFRFLRNVKEEKIFITGPKGREGERGEERRREEEERRKRGGGELAPIITRAKQYTGDKREG